MTTTTTTTTAIELKEQIKKLQLLLPKKEISASNLDARECKKAVVSSINEELLKVSKVYRETLKEVKLLDSDDLVKTILTDSQKQKFNYSQWCELIKSHSLILRVNKSYLKNDDTITVSKYINMIIKGSCLSSKMYQDRKKNKTTK